MQTYYVDVIYGDITFNFSTKIRQLIQTGSTIFWFYRLIGDDCISKHTIRKGKLTMFFLSKKCLAL